MTTTTAQWRELGSDEGGAPDLYVGPDDFGAAAAPTGGGEGGPARNPRLDLAELVRQPGVSLSSAALICAPAILGYSLGDTPTTRLLFAAGGAALGVLAVEYLQRQGVVD